MLRSREIVVLSLAALAVAIGARSASAQTLGRSGEQCKVTARFATQPPLIDGKLDDPCWKTAQVADQWQALGGRGMQADVQSIGRVAYDAVNLYVSIVAMEPHMDRVNFADPRTGVQDERKLFWTDRVEVFLAPYGEGRFQFVLNGKGARYDGAAVAANFDAFNADWKAGASIGTDRYTVEMAIPFIDLAGEQQEMRSPGPGDEWRINFCRGRTMGHRHMLWSDTGRGFHTPSRFGYLMFGPRTGDYATIRTEMPATWKLGENEITVKALGKVATPITVKATLEHAGKTRVAGEATIPAGPTDQEVTLKVAMSGWGASLLTVNALQNNQALYRRRVRIHLFDVPAALAGLSAQVQTVSGRLGAAPGGPTGRAESLRQRTAKLSARVAEAQRTVAAAGAMPAKDIRGWQQLIDQTKDELVTIERLALQLRLRHVWSMRKSMVLYDFEGSSQSWQSVPEGQASAACKTSGDTARTGASSLRIKCNLPEASGAFVKLPQARREWYPFTHLKLSICVPLSHEAIAGTELQAIICLKDASLSYYQCLRKNPLTPGAWTDVSLDLTANSDDWQSKDHYKPWDGYCRQDVQELGVRFVSKTPYTGPVYLDTVLVERREGAFPKRNAIQGLRANSARVKRCGKFELSFNLARTYRNPFDPDEVNVQGRFITPSQKVIEVPGFFYQGYLRRMEKGRERLTPMGHSMWKVRFAPTEVGTYAYHVKVEDGETISSEMGSFQCVESDSPGFVRISTGRDRFYFEFDDGSFYFPIGHNVASVHDARAQALGVNIPAEEGTFAYDRILCRMGEAGENFTRLWMSPWSFGIEWTKAYAVDYQGLGRYNLRNAWRLDHVLRTTEKNGIYAMLLMAGHGEIGDYESDFWGHDPRKTQGSPYWSRYGGPIDHPRDIYTSEQALHYYKRRARYIVARWGYSTAIMAWEVFNEADLPGFYQNADFGRKGAEFIRRLSTHIKDIDPFDHLVTSGCFRFKRHWATPLLQLETLDFNTGHVFTANLETQLYSDMRYVQGMEKGKLFLPTEAGLTPFAVDADSTALTMHRTLWASYMMPMAGTAAPWWWVLIDQRDLYSHFAAVSRFARGEDKRGKKLQTHYGTAANASGRQLKVIALTDAAQVKARAVTADGTNLDATITANGNECSCWVYDPIAFTSRGTWQMAVPSTAQVTIPGLKAGRYRIEIWDTYKGEVMETIEGEAAPAEISTSALDPRTGAKVDAKVKQVQLKFQTTTFLRDIACKIKPMATDAGGAPTGQ